MLNQREISETLHMIDREHLDIRTVTMGISLRSCCDPNPDQAVQKVYDTICRRAEKRSIRLHIVRPLKMCLRMFIFLGVL